jgi:hypothetical protein
LVQGKNKEKKMRTMKHLLAVLLIVGASGILMAGACDDGVCGPCGELKYGDATISGDARLDGLFKAVGTLGTATASIKANFDAKVEELAAVFMTQAEIDASGNLVADLKAKIQAEISANVEGGLKVKYQEPKCSANVNVAVEAQASCEAKAGCTAECDPGSVEVDCKGECSGSCEGSCEGGELKCSAELSAEGKCEASCEGSCEVQGPSVECSGACSGTCTVEAGVQCNGACDGNCTGTCDGSTADGVACDGVCEGECDAECHIQGSANCEGSCNGKCEYTPPDGQCEGTCKGECNVTVEANATCEGEPPKCEGKCEGKCSAECSGEVTPPSCSADCDASAKCQGQASAQASASLECTPPSLEIGFEMKAGVDAAAKAEFMAKMEAFKVQMIAILQGMKQLDILLKGNAELGIQSPLAQITAQVQAMISAGFGEFDVPAGLLNCVLPAFNEAASILSHVAGDMSATVSGQVELYGILFVG